MHLNIAALNKHLDDLHSFLASITPSFKNFGITVHKNNINQSLIGYLWGYNFECDPILSSYGGTGIFVANEISYIFTEMISNLSCSSL